MGANFFDMSYESVESLITDKHNIMSDKTILPHQFVNSTIMPNQLKEHNIVIIHVKPSSILVKLEGVEPNGMTFEKESKNGFLYHILQRSNQGDSYFLKISNNDDQVAQIDAIIGEDPFLSKNCNVSYGIKCNIVQMSMGMVAFGIIMFVTGVFFGLRDFKKDQRLGKK